MKKPIRCIESRYGDRAEYNFESLTVTKIYDGQKEVNRHDSKRSMWADLRELKATWEDRSF